MVTCAAAKKGKGMENKKHQEKEHKEEARSKEDDPKQRLKAAIALAKADLLKAKEAAEQTRADADAVEELDEDAKADAATAVEEVGILLDQWRFKHAGHVTWVILSRQTAYKM